MWKIIAWVSFLALVNCQSTQVAQCDRTDAPIPLHTYIEGCEIPTCLLSSRGDAVIHMVFQATRTMRSMRTRVRAFVGSVEVDDYPLNEDSYTCNFLTNTYCPVLETEIVHYTLRMPLMTAWIIAGTVTLEFRVEDEATLQPAFCIRVPIRVVL